ncbi:disease resistance protein RPV1 isoform X1 [Hevea brasiliensis]|uniref:disease resistance protein RPV1 isoform X1 n=1 Tax=Hevea brasiliensis TaxID=3981 RepID=UPI0025D53678|nr:disease resistance protein RPV1 isoform X1 [Hevea brasiliensis]
MASTSSSIIPSKITYDVFLSFRGSDTRSNFTSHIYAALCRKHITTFIDDNSLDRGEEIKETLLKAIEESKIYVIIFSENYASSHWCLDELVKIMECMKTMGRKVLPVFYHVDPSDVRKQTGKLGEAFGKVKQQFKESIDRVERWSTALTEAANLSGWDSSNYRLESELSERIVNQIAKKLYPIFFSTSTDLVGIDSHIEQILSLLSIGAVDVRFVGIWGMGGIGKTTIAEALICQIFDQFDDFCFLRNIREKSKKHELVHLRKCLFSELLQDENLSIEMLHVIPTFAMERLRRKRVVVVLDDVNDSDQLTALVGNHGWFGPGSRVIITSRDKEVLNGKVDEIYKVEGLRHSEACQLFSLKAFKQKYPPKDFMELSERVVDYTKGLPLALHVLGSHLCGRFPAEWKSALSKLNQFPDSNIQKILKISYDELDPVEKDIFLDIACFFKGNERNWVEDILNGCGFPASWGILRLLDKCLITIVDDILEMHDLIQEMGQNIARRKGRRLWNSKDIFHMLSTKMCPQQLKRLNLSESVHLRRLPNLSSATELEWISLQGCESLLEIPMSIQCLQKLVCLDLQGCKKLRSLPNLVQLKSLKELSLSYCSNLKMLPEIPIGIEELELEDCGLEGLPSSVPFLEDIYILKLRNCENLLSLPSSFHLKNVDALDLSGCSNLTKLPEIIGDLKVLLLNKTAIEELPSSIRSFSSLVVLNMKGCESLKNLPSCICDMKFLQMLILSGCSKLGKLPPLYGLCSLRELYVDGTALVEIPIDIYAAECLHRLVLSGCSKLAKLRPLHDFSHLTLSYLDGTVLIEILIKRLNGRRSTIVMYHKRLHALPLNCTLMDTAGSYIVPIAECEELSGSYNVYNYCNSVNWDQNARGDIMVDALLRMKEISITSYVSLSFPLFFLFLILLLHQIFLLISFLFFIFLFFIFYPSLTHGQTDAHVIVGLPGSEIPECFNYQSPGSSMDVLFPQCCFNSLFLGFAFCVVLDFEVPVVPKEGDCFYFACECRFKIPMRETYDNERSGRFLSSLNLFEVVFESDHLFLFYYKPSYFCNLNHRLMQSCCNVMEASVVFKSEFKYSQLKVKMCGIQLLYSKDVLHKCNASIKQSKFSSRYGATRPEFLQVMETDANKKRSRENSFPLDCITIIADGKSDYEEEEQPHPKRVK